MNKRGICSPHVHVNYIINLIHHVKSVRTVYEQSLLCFKNSSRLLRFSSLDFRYYVLLDIDECLSRSHACDVTANCSNTYGSHNCTCKEGYTGDGHSYQGMIITLD